ncbi:MAG: PH domain-containing protein [Mycobacteriales bacterium]
MSTSTGQPGVARQADVAGHPADAAAARRRAREFRAALTGHRPSGASVLDIRPVLLRRFCLTVAVVAVLACTAGAVVLRDGSGAHTYRVSDQIALGLLGVAITAGMVVLARPHAVAHPGGVWVRNYFGTREIPWDLIEAVRYPPKAPWAALVLTGGDLLSIVALQAVDGKRAVRDLHALREMHERYAG